MAIRVVDKSGQFLIFEAMIGPAFHATSERIYQRIFKRLVKAYLLPKSPIPNIRLRVMDFLGDCPEVMGGKLGKSCQLLSFYTIIRSRIQCLDPCLRKDW